MELNFKVYITLGLSKKCQTYKWFTFDYEPSREEWDTFARECDFKDAIELLTLGEEEDVANEIKEEFVRNPWCCECYLDDHTKALFQEFLQNKYEDIVNEWIGENLTIASEKDLNDILKYDM